MAGPSNSRAELHSLADEVTVVVRSSGERTAPACRQLLGDLLPGATIHEVGGGRFVETLRDCLQLGLKEHRPWTLAVDADLLPASNAIQHLLHHAGLQPEAVPFIQGWQLDKLFGCFRQGGPRLYRTAHLPLALRELETIDPGEKRPERRLLTLLAQLGHPYALAPRPAICLHDFEQFYSDIYRKAFVHAGKNRDYIHLMMASWQRLQHGDPDLQVALRGAQAGLAAPGPVLINRDSHSFDIRQVLDSLGLQEKAPDFLPPTPAQIRHMIDDTRLPLEMDILRRKLGDRPQPDTLLRRLRGTVAALGWRYAIPWIIGARMKKVASALIEGSEQAVARRAAARAGKRL